MLLIKNDKLDSLIFRSSGAYTETGFVDNLIHTYIVDWFREKIEEGLLGDMTTELTNEIDVMIMRDVFSSLFHKPFNYQI